MIRPEEISSIIRDRIKKFALDQDVAETGKVIEVGDGIARVYGISNVMYNEMLLFPNDVFGMALNLEENSVGCVLFGEIGRAHV